MHARVHALGLQALAVDLGARRDGQELHQQALLTGAFALHQELLRVVLIFDVLVPIHAAHMARDELLALIDAHAIGIGLERQAMARVARRHRVVVGVQRNAKLLGGAHRTHACQVEAGGVEPSQMGAFVFE